MVRRRPWGYRSLMDGEEEETMGLQVSADEEEKEEEEEETLR